MKIDLAKAEERIMEGLKDFQRATVDRVIEPVSYTHLDVYKRQV